MVNYKLKPLVLAVMAISSPAFAGPLLDPGVAAQTIFSDNTTSTGANSKVFGNIQAGNVLTNGANGYVYGNLVSPLSITSGGASSYVGGSIESGGVATTGLGSVTTGSIKASGTATIGANAQLYGNMTSDGVLTTGDTSVVNGYVTSGGTATVGANAKVLGTVSAVGLIAISASATTKPSVALTSQPFDALAYTAGLTTSVDNASASVSKAQAALNAMGVGTVLAATMTTSQILTPGVYSAPSFSTTAGITLTLNGENLAGQFFVFNIADILSFGGVSHVVLENWGADSSVIWNSSGYTTTGDGSTVIGTILSKTYVMVGANSIVTGAGTSCGGIYSAKSYVSTGDTSQVGGNGCTVSNILFKINSQGVAEYDVPPPPAAHAAVPEPATWAMVLTGFALVGLALRRRAAPVCARYS